VKFVGVTKNFKDHRLLQGGQGRNTRGFRVECKIKADGVLSVDLVRDISFDKNGMKRPTNLLFSADSAKPYEVEPITTCLRT
jgi:hypothetical protein